MTPLLNPLPWYKSPNYLGIVTAIVSALAVMFPKAAVALHLATPAIISQDVNTVFEIVGLVGLLVSERTRRNSTIQPIVLTAASAQAQSTPVTQEVQAIHDALQEPKK